MVISIQSSSGRKSRLFSQLRTHHIHVTSDFQLVHTTFLDSQNFSSFCDFEFRKFHYLYDVCKHIGDKRPLTDSAYIQTLDTTSHSSPSPPKHHSHKHGAHLLALPILALLAIPLLALPLVTGTSFVHVVISSVILLPTAKFFFGREWLPLLWAKCLLLFFFFF